MKIEPGIRDMDDGNGVYDVPTLSDIERWKQEADIREFINNGGTLEEYRRLQNTVPF
jgi:hypothetical protein